MFIKHRALDRGIEMRKSAMFIEGEEACLLERDFYSVKNEHLFERSTYLVKGAYLGVYTHYTNLEQLR